MPLAVPPPGQPPPDAAALGSHAEHAAHAVWPADARAVEGFRVQARTKAAKFFSGMDFRLLEERCQV